MIKPMNQDIRILFQLLVEAKSRGDMKNIKMLRLTIEAHLRAFINITEYHQKPDPDISGGYTKL